MTTSQAIAAGDYFAGPSHCLPTGTTARFASGISVWLMKSDAINVKQTVSPSSFRYRFISFGCEKMIWLETLDREGPIRLADRCRELDCRRRQRSPLTFNR